ncbi:uncharacterized protein LOC143250517 isoform X1 [Tachypleus tridentatus]|uniref:uncharacterized protein LOC143250517 isoform X1 n=1 Tax=Tachypleus tridentatus TaxID=6853 RepID=UPI003FD639BD
MTKNNAEDSDCVFVRKRSMSLFPPSIHKPDEGATNDTDNESISSHIPDVQKENTNRRRYWKAWNSLPDEATDNEMEDNYERIDINRILQLCPPPRPARTEEEILEDLAGEYVTFVFAHRYACRDLDNSNQKWSSLPVTPHICENALADPLNQSTISTRNRRQSISNSASSSSVSTSMASSCNQNCKKHGNYDNLMNLWNKLGTVEIKTDNSEETGSTSSESSWKQNAALRRVQSFTGIAKAKVASLHQSLSFRQQSTNSSGLPPKPKIVPRPKNKRKDYEEITLFSIPPPPVSHSKESSSPTTPAVWLKQQQNHLVESSSKCGSLPSGFHLDHGYNDMGPNKSTSHLDVEKGRMRVETSHNLYSDHRPFTNASDKPLCDFMEDLEEYIASASYRKQHDFRFPVNSEDRLATCATTPAASMENMSIHPEHKVYRQVGSRYATLRTVISNVSSKISFLKANFGSPMTDQSDNKSVMSNISDSSSRLESMDERPVCCSTAKSNQESDTKVLKTRFGNSIARAYSTMRKQRLSKDEETRESKSIPNDCISKKNPVYVHKPGSSVIGARIAGIHESEYCVPGSLFVCRQLRSNKDEDVRPDSLLSDSSNTTSSSDGDKFSGGSYMNAPFESLLSLSDNITQKDRMEKEISSENNESYGDSFYERSFEATESTMPEDLFRDSAIYSDPEDADLSTTESSSVTNYEASPTLCAFPEINITSKDVFDSEKIETKKLSFLDASGSESKNQNVSKIHCTKKLHPADTITSEDLNQSSEKIVRKKNMNCSETIPKNTLNIEPRPIEIVCTPSVNGTTLEKLKILGEENPKLHKEITPSPTNGSKNTENKQGEIIKLQKEFIPQLVETANVKNQIKLPSLVDGLKSIHQRQNEDIKFLNKLTPLSVDMKNTPEEIKSQIELTPIFNHGLKDICQKQNEDIRIQKELNESLVDGLKSIHQRRLELEKWCTQRVNQDSKESSSTHSNPCFKIITEDGVKEVSTAFSSTEPADTQPMPAKGWVKHIVSKFQSES